MERGLEKEKLYRERKRERSVGGEAGKETERNTHSLLAMRVGGAGFPCLVMGESLECLAALSGPSGGGVSGALLAGLWSRASAVPYMDLRRLQAAPSCNYPSRLGQRGPLGHANVRAPRPSPLGAQLP
jgi:hypothetical protein